MANPAELTAQELVERYSIRFKLGYCPCKGLYNLDEVVVAMADLALAEQAYNAIAAKTEEIVAVLKAKEAAAAEAKEAAAKALEAIEGMAEIKATTHGGDYYRLLRKYPKAAAYIEADNWANSNIAVKVIAGLAAREQILNGEDYNIAIEEMNLKFRAYAEQLAIK